MTEKTMITKKNINQKSLLSSYTDHFLTIQALFNLYGQHFSYIKDHNVRQICRVLMSSYYTIENGGSCYLIERFITSALNIHLITMYT